MKVTDLEAEFICSADDGSYSTGDDAKERQQGVWFRAPLTLGPGRNGARSVLLTSGCAWHGYVTAGEVTIC